MPENKALLLLALSDLGGLFSSVTLLADLHLVQAITAWRWITMPLRPLSRTLACSRPFQVKQFQRSPVPRERVLAARSRLLDAGCLVEEPPSMYKR